MGKIPAEKVAEVRDRVDIEQVVGRSVRLTRAGSRMVGLCPFHREKTPSFGVSREKQLYHCFGCGVGGDVFDFVMRLEGLEFPEAVRNLAKEAGVALPEEEESPEERERRSYRDALLSVNDLAARFYEQHLARAQEAQAYLGGERGLTPETARRFRLGWAPADWHRLSEHLEHNRVDLRLAQTLGLLGTSARDGRFYDRLRGRVVFPIALPGGAIAGFGARRADWVDAEGPKYLNSPESPVYDKAGLLYGLAQARDEIRRARKALLVEGYLDVISLHQAGVGTAVAACGTALAPRHVQLLGRLTEEVITCYDGDAAGRDATRKAAELLLGGGLGVRVLELPGGEDPDTFVQKIGGTAFQKLIDEAPAAIDFFLTEARSRFAGGGIAGTTSAVEAVKPLILAVRDPFQRDVTIEAAARQLGLQVATLRHHLGARPEARDRSGQAPRGPARPETRRPETRQAGLPVVETALLRMLIERPAEVLAELERRQALRAFSSEAVRAAVDGAREALGAGQRFDGARALEAMQAAGAGDVLLSEIRQNLMVELPVAEPLAELAGRLVKEHHRRRKREVQRLIEQAVRTGEPVEPLLAEAAEIDRALGA